MPVIAIVGASNDRRKFGNKALRAYRQQGYTVVPVNPREPIIEGERAFARITDYPGPIDEATVYLHPDDGLEVLEDIARKGVKTVWLNPGAERDDVVERAKALGLAPIVACSILGVGERPENF